MMSVAEYKLLQDLKRRMEAVEHELVALRQTVQVRNARWRAQDVPLRDLIEQIQTELGSSTGKRVLQALAQKGVEPLPAIRTVRWHLAQLRTSRPNTAARAPFVPCSCAAFSPAQEPVAPEYLPEVAHG